MQIRLSSKLSALLSKANETIERAIKEDTLDEKDVRKKCEHERKHDDNAE
jgi:hypothetical protein